jgi:hypothetical protein
VHGRPARTYSVPVRARRPSYPCRLVHRLLWCKRKKETCQAKLPRSETSFVWSDHEVLGSPDGSISTLGQHHLHPLGSTLPPWNWNSGIPKLPIFTLTPRPSMVSMDCCCSSRRVAALTSPADVRRLLLVLQLVWPPRAQPERISSRDARRLPAMLVSQPSRRAPNVHSAHACCRGALAALALSAAARRVVAHPWIRPVRGRPPSALPSLVDSLVVGPSASAVAPSLLGGVRQAILLVWLLLACGVVHASSPGACSSVAPLTACVW